ncbi:MAG: SpoIIIAH-like family protein [Lachnospiraceae bacterium]|nr:SpoIIIAH-like family protein [Lachnospiraceae bacterium]
MKKQWNKIWKRNQVMITALACMIALAGYLNFTGRELKKEAIYTSIGGKNAEDTKKVANQNSLQPEESADYIYDISMEDLEESADIESLDEDMTAKTTDPVMEELADPELEETTARDLPLDEASTEKAQAVTGEEFAKGAKEGENPGEAVFTNTTGVLSLEQANLMREQVRAQNRETLLGIINHKGISEEAKTQAVSSMVEMTQIAKKECDAQILLEAKGFEHAVVSISGERADVMVAASELTDAQRAQIEDIVKRKTEIAAENIVITPISNP